MDEGIYGLQYVNLVDVSAVTLYLILAIIGGGEPTGGFHVVHAD